MEPATCIDVIRTEAARLGAVAERSPAAPLARYPGRRVRDLVAHVLTVHEWVAGIVAERPATRPERRGLEEPLSDVELTGRFAAAWQHLAGLLEAADPADPVWSFGSEQTIGFWQHRMAHETAIHRWDAARAESGSPEPIPSRVAVSGLREALHIHLAGPLDGFPVGGSGERIGLRCTDHPAAWTVTLLPHGIRVDETVEPATTAAHLEAPAAELWLAITGRRPLAYLTGGGDTGAVDRLTAAIAAIPDAI